MDFLNKLGSSIAAGAADAKEKAKDAVEIGRLKSQIKSAEKGIAECYAAVGKKLLEEMPELAAANFAEQLENLNVFKGNIAECERLIQLVKDTDSGKMDDAE